MGRVVVALGGNALIRRGEPGSTEVQRQNLDAAAAALVRLIEAGHELVVTHGNGPQVGFLALEAEAARADVPPPPLDVLGAESQGQIGYLLERALRSALAASGLIRGRAPEVVTILSEVVVDPDDPAFGRPTKPVGPIYDAVTAARLAVERGWTVARDDGSWRRVVASPEPLRLVPAEAIRHLADEGFLVVASGGGGIPVVEVEPGRYEGVEGVIDKDLAAVVLARAVDADALLLLTDVDAVYRDWGTPRAAPIARLGPPEAARLARSGAFGSGSMGPKVEACLRFAADGRLAAIGSLEEALEVLSGRAGTRIGGASAADRPPRTRPIAPRRYTPSPWSDPSPSSAPASSPRRCPRSTASSSPQPGAVVPASPWSPPLRGPTASRSSGAGRIAGSITSSSSAPKSRGS